LFAVRLFAPIARSRRARVVERVRDGPVNEFVS